MKDQTVIGILALTGIMFCSILWENVPLRLFTLVLCVAYLFIVTSSDNQNK